VESPVHAKKDLYATASSICRAALHNGAIKDEVGG